MHDLYEAPMTERNTDKRHKYHTDGFDTSKLRQQEIEYLKSLVESGEKIPKEKVNLFKLLVLKEDPLKIGEQMLKKNKYFKNLNILNQDNNSKIEL